MTGTPKQRMLVGAIPSWGWESMEVGRAGVRGQDDRSYPTRAIIAGTGEDRGGRRGIGAGAVCRFPREK